MIYQIKGRFYEEIQKSKVFSEIGIESKALLYIVITITNTVV